MSGIIDPQAWLIMVWALPLPENTPEGSCCRAHALKEESQRDSVEQPRVARPRETLGKTRLTHNPKGVAPKDCACN